MGIFSDIIYEDSYAEEYKKGYAEGYKKGFAEGYKKGCKETKQKFINNFLPLFIKEGKSDEYIANALHISFDIIQEYRSKNNDDNH